MRILVTGSRDWDDADAIAVALMAHAGYEPAIVVHGACPTGADWLADIRAETWGWQVERHPADWKTFGKGAGPCRNAEMVALGADVCLAFIKDGSRGASDCAAKAEAAGIPTVRFTS